jgi:hypothetical protein
VFILSQKGCASPLGHEAPGSIRESRHLQH